MMEKVYRMTIEHHIVRLTLYKFLELLNDDDNFTAIFVVITLLYSH